MSALVAKDRPLGTIFDARAPDIPIFGRCLKENKRLATIILSDNFEVELRMVTEVILVVCEATRLPHNLDKVNYCIEQWHKSAEQKARQAMSQDALEETLPKIIRALMPHSPTSESVPANSCIICYRTDQPAPKKC